jgi:ABC-2 type transport system permease protein
VLAANDITHYWHFLDAAEAYRYELAQTMNRHDAEVLEAGGPSFPRGERWLYETVRPFAYQPPSPGWALRESASALAALCGWLLVASIAAAMAVRREGRPQ